MSSSLRRGALAASAIAFSIASLAACGAGTNAQTLQITPDNAETRVGTVKVQNATVITQPELKSTGPAVVAATLFNNDSKAQTLQSVSVAGSTDPVKLTPAKGGSLTIPAHGSLILGGKGNASAVIARGREAMKDGDVQSVTFTFSITGPVTLQSFVVPASSYFTGWGPSQVPSAPATSATGTPSGGASGAPGHSAPPKDGATPSGSATGKPGESSESPVTPSDSASQSALGG